MLLEKSFALPAKSPYALPEPAGGAVSTELAAAARAPGMGLISFPAEGPLDGLASGAWRSKWQGQDAGELTEGGASDDTVDGPSGSGETSLDCHDAHPNADSPDMLHVVFASDISQSEGVQASVASVVSSAASPDELTIHIMVQVSSLAGFKERFAIRPECQGTVTETGVLVKVHGIDPKLIERAVAKVPNSIKQERGAIDTVENFARFYMHLILERAVVIYLDADTIVQADLGLLRKELIASGKTIGFVARKSEVRMDKFLRKPKGCSAQLGASWKSLYSLPAYNVGVFAVNLQRWKEQRVAERVEDLVAQHNRCGGKLWVGGSQPPLLLAFLNLKEGEAKDYIVFDAAWNYGDLGWRKNIPVSKLTSKKVLHWNGNKKPWNPDGLYRDVWLPHRQRFNTLLKPYGATVEGPAGALAPPASPAQSKVAAKVKSSKVLVTTTLSVEELEARAACPSVQLLDEWGSDSITGQKCRMGKSYGCPASGHGGVYAKDGCFGLFSVSDKATVCGRSQQECAAGVVPKPSSSCGLMILTTYFTTKKDWQRGKFAKPSYSKLQKLYQTTAQNGLNVSVVYDQLPDDLIAKYTSDRFHFVQVDLNDFDKRYGVNDVRYFFFERLLRENKDWEHIFIVDAFDVRVPMNPCPGIQKDKLYVGGEQDKLNGHPWMKARFSKMGGKYNTWYKTKVDNKMKILNCGITGGHRKVMQRLFGSMIKVLQDPALSARKKDEDINLNMAALNFIVYTEFEGQFINGQPLHSVYKRFQTKRKDVWFVHK